MIQILTGDCRDVLKTLADASVDSIVCDPPYHLTTGKKGGTGEASVNLESPYGRARIGTGFMGMKWDGGDVAFQVAMWAECLRVLKPGGHLLAFSGTRTQHRMVCAIEDAGFEIRDQVGWLFGTGFPKNLDVSKAIDKAAGAVREVVGKRTDGRYAYEFSDAAKKALGGVVAAASDTGFSGEMGQITAPATDAAKQWEGWGTALKPAWEPICVARKPLGTVAVDVLANVEDELHRRGIKEIRWSEPVSAVASRGRRSSSSSTPAQLAAATSAGPVAASETPNAAQPTVSSSEPTTWHGASEAASMSEATQSNGESRCETPSSRPTGQLADAVASQSAHSSPSITSKAAEPLTDGPSMGRSTSNCGAMDSRQATESFAGIATGLTGSRAHARINRLPDGSFEWPDGLPMFVPATGLTVVANVLAHGTGALNIDGCRIEGTKDVPASPRRVEQGAAYGDLGNDPGTGSGWDKNVGRWPANLLHDGSPEVVALFPAEAGAQAPVTVRNGDKFRGTYGAFAGNVDEAGSTFQGDSGSAARFFWCPKTSAADRHDGLQHPGPQFKTGSTLRAAENLTAKGNCHPTVKPTELMRYLCRLVTPPGGTVLDPFMGSGSTLKAAELEGFSAIGIELDPAYVEIAKRRIGADAPLFAEVRA